MSGDEITMQGYKKIKNTAFTGRFFYELFFIKIIFINYTFFIRVFNLDNIFCGIISIL